MTPFVTDVEAVVGYFDPLLAEHSEALAAIGKPLLVFVRNPENPMLPLRARCELVAALRSVDTVIALGDSPVPEAWQGKVLDLTADDLERREGLVRHILSRYAAG